MTTWVVNASPLIFLAELGYLDMLDRNADTICAPRAVLDEVHAKPDRAAQAVDQATRSWLSVREVGNREAVEILQADLDLGEAEVIVLARQIDADRVVMDDLDARRMARRLGLDLIGTIGLLLSARLRGEIPSMRVEIPSMRVEIDRLEALGFRVAPDLVTAVLRAAGE